MVADADHKPGKPPAIVERAVPRSDAPKRLGRPPIPFDQDVADLVCERLCDGVAMRRIVGCDGVPDWKTLWKWLDENPSFFQQYTRARMVQAQRYADEVIEIADSADAENAHAVRVRLDARRWLLSKVLPKLYGDAVGAAAPPPADQRRFSFHVHAGALPPAQAMAAVKALAGQDIIDAETVDAPARPDAPALPPTRAQASA